MTNRTKGEGEPPASSAPYAKSAFSLYANEEAVLDKTDIMLRRLAEVAGGVQDLAEAYRRGYREQRQLVRMSDRMQLDLQSAVQRLAEQARELQELNEKLQSEIEHRTALEDQLRRLAETDALTGALSRRRFLELAEAAWLRQGETGVPACLLMLDLDRFKTINDRHGHAAGDRALESFGAACRQALRECDLMGRLGGEEFAVILPDCNVETGRLAAEALRNAVAGLSVGDEKGVIPLSVSIGIAEGRPGESIDETMSRADRALYRAKGAGRNRSEVFAPVHPTRGAAA